MMMQTKNLLFSLYFWFIQSPFLSIGDAVNLRCERHRGSSPISGDFVIEDVDVNGQTFRRLVFLSSRNLVQSEAKLIKGYLYVTNLNTFLKFPRNYLYQFTIINAFLLFFKFNYRLYWLIFFYSNIIPLISINLLKL